MSMQTEQRADSERVSRLLASDETGFWRGEAGRRSPTGTPNQVSARVAYC
jgi:hypothetical protein